MSLFEPRFIGLSSHLILQIEGSELGSERIKKLTVKPGLKSIYPLNNLDAQDIQILERKEK